MGGHACTQFRAYTHTHTHTHTHTYTPQLCLHSVLCIHRHTPQVCLYSALCILTHTHTHTHTHTLKLWLPCPHWAGIFCFLFMHHLQVAAMIPQHLHIIPAGTKWIRREEICSVMSTHVCLCLLIAFNKQAKQEERWIHWVSDRKCTGVRMGGRSTSLRLQQQPDRHALYSKLLSTVDTYA